MCFYSSLFLYTRAVFITVVFLTSTVSFAEQTQQTLIMAGSDLVFCSSTDTKNCSDTANLYGKRENLFSVTKQSIKAIAQAWPTANTEHRDTVIVTLNELINSELLQVNKTTLLWAWRDLNERSLTSLNDNEFNYVFDMLEIAVVNKHQQRIKEQLFHDLTTESASTEIMDFAAASIRVIKQTAKAIVITAASRDPYADADYYEALFASNNISTEWLALTPASADALMSGQCQQLTRLREQKMQLFNRESIYPDRTDAEFMLCEQGINALLQQIKTATAVVFSEGENNLASGILFDRHGKTYPWFNELVSRPVILAMGAGSAMQSGGKNSYGTVPMILNGTSIAALREGSFAGLLATEGCENACNDKLSTDSLSYEKQGGLGSFNYGVIDSHFSEHNRTMRLASLLADTKQRHGFGIDENTALVSIRDGKSSLMTVLGQRGVVHVTSVLNGTGTMSYWPAGTVVDVKDQGFYFSKRTIDKALANINIPPLPMQRFANIFSNAKLRSLVQAMCLTQEQQAVAQHDEFLLDLNATDNTHYYRINKSNTGCGVENLAFKVKRF